MQTNMHDEGVTNEQSFEETEQINPELRRNSEIPQTESEEVAMNTEQPIDYPNNEGI